MQSFYIFGFYNMYNCKVFSTFKKVNIFFDDSKKAAKKLNSIWNNIDEWWHNKELQEVRINFCKKYSYLNNNLINEITREIKN